MTARWQEPVITAGAAAVIVTVSLAPLVLLAIDALASATIASLSLQRLAALFGSTVSIAVAVAVVAIALGVPLGLVLARTDVPGRRAAIVLHAFPLFLPPFLLALGWFHIVSGFVFSRAGLVAVLAQALTPVVTLLTLIGLDGIDPTLEDAARTVARPFAVARRILLPLVAPAIALAALVVFALAFSEVGVPMFLRVRTYPAAVLARLGGVAYAPGEAFLLVLPLLGLAVGLAVVERRFAGIRTLAAMDLRLDRPRWPLGASRWPLGAACWTVVILGLAPVAALGCVAMGGDRIGDALLAAIPSARNSLVAAAITATIAVAIGLVLAWPLAGGRTGARAVDAVAALAFITPAAALGAGLIAVWNRPATASIYGGPIVVVLGLLARYAVLGLRPLAVAIAHTPPHLDEAARATGASYLRRLGGIVAPLHRRALLATWLLVAIFALRDLETVVMFYPAGHEPLTVRIFTLEANGSPPMVAALASLHVAITAAVVLAGAAVIGRPR